MDEKTIARFWSKVEKRGPDECWEWRSELNSQGYGRFSIYSNGQRRRTSRPLAHRISFELARGPIAAGLFIMHRCDNPLCVNPAHLSTGTHDDNQRDCNEKGRRPRGDTHWNRRLRGEDVDAIREALGGGVRPYKVATRFGVSIMTILDIKHGRTWTHRPLPQTLQQTSRG